MKCAVCLKKKNEANKRPYFKVPLDESERHRWSAACGTQLRARDFICSDHFARSDVIYGGRQTRLLAKALPLLAPSCASVANCDVESLGENRQFGTEIFAPNVPANSINTCKTCGHSIPSSTFCVSKVQMKDCETQTDWECSISEPTEAQNYEADVLKKDFETQTDPIMLEVSSQIENSDLRKEIKRLSSENKTLVHKLDEADAVLGRVNKIFTEGQVKKMIFPDGKLKWSYKDISSAICLHAAGPRAYHHLYDNGFPLPHVSTLQRWYRKCDVSEGLLMPCLNHMKYASELSNDDKICILAFDEMKVTETYEYDQPGDYARKPANMVQVVMARGLLKSWKQPIFYDFDCPMTASLLKEIISAVHNVGFPVVGVVSDMGSTNRSLWTELGVTPDKPYFAHPIEANEKVLAFADPPHLLKLIRNHYNETGLLWKEQLLTNRTICDVIRHTSSSDMSIAFKVNEDHLKLSGKAFASQKVKHAAHLFSNTTANAIRRCSDLGFAVYKPVESADLFKLVNDWFDVLNSNIKTFGYPGKEPFGTALENQLDVLGRMSDYMRNPIIPGKNGLEHFQRGILMTNMALVMLYEYMKAKSNVEYILTNRLNQDILEHFFGAIRSKGGLNDHPSPQEFKYRIRKYILARNTECLQGTGNVQNDTTEWLNVTDPTTPEKSGDCAQTTTAECLNGMDPDSEADLGMETDVVNALNEPQSECGVLQNDALEYVSGYIIKKLKLQEHHTTEYTSSYVDLASKGYLKKPSTQFLHGIVSLENIFHSINSTEIAHCRNLHKQLMNKSAAVDLPENAKKLFFKCRIFFRIKNLNRRLKVQKAKQRIMGYKKFIKIKL